MSNSALLDRTSVSSYDPTVVRAPSFASRWSAGWTAQRLLHFYNRLRRALPRSTAASAYFKRLEDVELLASATTNGDDIDEHLEVMFIEGLLCRPKVIVELGVRSGVSTRVFERIAGLCGSTIISADLEDCSAVSPCPRWHFFRGDDIYFAQIFPQFCKELRIPASIDLLFIDTSHYYDHTTQEIQSWFPLLSPHAKVMFHDTNLRLIGFRQDGCFQLAWDNKRGVIRAVEEYLGIQIDETARCAEYTASWLVRHWPNCNGFTVLDRLTAGHEPPSRWSNELRP